MIVKVKNNQTIADIALQECGALEAIIDIADNNELSLTHELTPGSTVNVDNRDNKIIDYYRSLRHSPATALTESSTILVKEEGIEFWIIEDDFIVS